MCYGEAAVRARELFLEGNAPQGAWSIAMQEVFPDHPAMREKGCPRCAFLGLCQEGLVMDVPSGHYTNSTKNKNYAVRAVECLINNPELADDMNELWTEVMQAEEAAVIHNGQMEVVIALWRANMIIFE